MKLSEFAKECRDTWKEDRSGVPVVGLEHLEPGEVKLSAWDVDSENTFTKRFNKGQVLLGRRRVYLRKAVVAPFDGICSGDITVIEAIPGKILPELLPFVIQNDAFFDYAEQGSAGSLSPRVKWEHLKDFEVNLPSIDDQKALAEKLWAAYRLKESYKKLLAATDEMVKSRFIEMFGSLSNNEKGWPTGKMVDACTYISDGSHYSPPDDSDSDIPMLSVKDMNQSGFVYDDCKHLSLSEYEKLCQNGCKPLLNDVLVAKDGSYFKYIFPLLEEREQAILSSIAILRPNSSKINARFLCELLKSKEVLNIVEQNYLTGTAIRRVILKGFRDLKAFFPPLTLQNEFERIYNQADKSGFELRKSIESIDAVIKSLINN